MKSTWANLYLAAASLLSGTLQAAELTGEAAWKLLTQAASTTPPAARAARVLLFRHALAPGVGDPPGFVLQDCSTQRNLSDEGRAQAKALGQQFAKRKITVAAVWHSEWCRARETAQLFAQEAEVKSVRIQPEPAFNSFFADRRNSDAQTAKAKALLLAWSKQAFPQQANAPLVVVTHQVNITALTGVVPQSGEGVMIERRGAQWHVIGTLKEK
jgi:phosphohistidine phosphatase SixA